MREKTLSEYVFRSKYAKELLGRRETYEETVDRYLSTFDFDSLSGGAVLHKELRDALLSKKISGSQRGLQFGGAAIKKSNARVYNCSSSFADRPSFFGEALYLLLCGCGVGFSVSAIHTDKLPPVLPTEGTLFFEVQDSIEGWADAATFLMNCYLLWGTTPTFDFSKVRPAGSPISHGGVAPGPSGLKKALENCAALLEKRINSRLRPIDCFDLVCYLADAVLSGGIRRSATLCAFDIDDEEMRSAKTGSWFQDNAQRARANISAIVLPDSPRAKYMDIFKSTKEFGEPGLLNFQSPYHITNPCAEIGMCPVLLSRDGVPLPIYELSDFTDPTVQYQSGWSFCNLSTINAAAIKPEELPKMARLASILGTLQAGLNKFPYLGLISEAIARRESLLGVSITGIYSDRGFFDKKLLQEAAHTARAYNQYYASELGIPCASRICCIKPEGTASLTLGVVSSGIHPYHARKYIRRVQAMKDEPLYKFIESIAPSACAKSVWGNEDLRVIAFACSAPASAITRATLTLEQHISDILLVNTYWVRESEGVQRVRGLHHNVSCTLSVPDDKWEWVSEKLYQLRDKLTGVSLLSEGGDYVYPQAPLQEILESEEPDHLIASALWDTVHALGELELPNINLGANEYGADAACAGGACLIPLFEAPATDITPSGSTDSTPS